MKRQIVFLLMILATNSILMAENVLQIKPQVIVPGNTVDDDECICIEMNNDETFVALQFDLWLPEGVEIDFAGIELDPDRFPWSGRQSNKKFYHSLGFSEQGTGHYRIECYSTDISHNVIDGNSGAIFYIYYNASEDMPKGILPIRITDVVLAIDGNHDVKPADCNSFFYTPDVDFSALTSIDLSATEGITTNDVATAARALMTNHNSLLYLNEGSTAEGLNNVVVGNVCDNLVLEDRLPFSSSKAFTATNASYTRTLDDDGWYSLCLPFDAATPEGISVERFTGLDAGKAEVFFTSGAIEADVPCIFNTKKGTVVFSATDAAVNATPETLQDGAFFGTYSLLPAGTITGCYALHPDGRGFGYATETAYTEPFRALVNPVSNVSYIKLRHGDDVETAVRSIETEIGSQIFYNTYGQRVNAQTKGIIIREGKKIINQ